MRDFHSQKPIFRDAVIKINIRVEKKEESAKQRNFEFTGKLKRFERYGYRLQVN